MQSSAFRYMFHSNRWKSQIKLQMNTNIDSYNPQQLTNFQVRKPHKQLRITINKQNKTFLWTLNRSYTLPFAEQNSRVSQVFKRCYFVYHRGQHIQYILNSNGAELNQVELKKTRLLLFYLFLDVIHEHCQLDVGLKREAPSIRIFVHQIQSVVASNILPHVDWLKKNLRNTDELNRMPS